jgi:1,4-dihydroxy-2-naphthoyl-CoA hydrolase
VTAAPPAGRAGNYIDWLGLELLEIGGDRVVATVELRPDHHQPYGIVHGGVHSSIVETVASMGAAEWYGERGQVVGVNNATDFLRAVRTGRLTATGTPVHRGRMQQLWLVEIRDADEKLVARGHVRLQNVPGDRFTG